MSALTILRHPVSPKETNPCAVEGTRRIMPITASDGLFYVGDRIHSNSRSLIREIEKTYQFEQGTFERIFNTLGKGDSRAGAARFELLAQAGAITVERVGFRKEEKGGSAKYYLMVNQTKGTGGVNQFHTGFSRQGTERAITRPKPHADVERNEHTDALIQEGLRNACILSKRSPEVSQAGFGRVMNAEEGIKASELGGEDLMQLMNSEGASREERCRIYESIFQGLHWIHSHGFVHKDLKLENVVVIRRKDVQEGRIQLDNVPDLETGDPQEIVGAKIIDHDFLAREGAVSPICCGTVSYYSPELVIRELAENKADVAHFKNDEWAFMYMICEMESIVYESNPDECLLSDAFLERFRKYQDEAQEIDAEGKINHHGYYARLKAMLIRNRVDLREKTVNLFAGITPKNSLENYLFSKAFFSLPQTPTHRHGSMQHKKRKFGQRAGQAVQQRVIPKEKLPAPVQAPVAQEKVVPAAPAGNSFSNLVTLNRVALIALLGFATFCAVKAMEHSELFGSKES